MYVSKIEIENVRGFDKVELDLDRNPGRHKYAGWTVIAGRNGTGKSTLLKAIALALAGPSMARSLQESFTGWIRSGSSDAEMKVALKRGPADAYVGATRPKSVFWVGLNMERQEQPEPTVAEAQVLRDWPENKECAEAGPWNDNPVGWFIAGYGPFRRLWGHAQDALRLMAGPPRLARVVSLFRDDASLVMSIDWLRKIYLRRLENKPGAAELEKSVLSLLNNGNLLGDMQIERIDSDALWARRNGTVFALEDLGEGYRVVTTMVLDIVKQLHECYGRLEIELTGNSLTVPHEGVVLIDEMESHLHVEWQKRIGFWLKQHFPNIQFIVTTHSPFICQAADPKGLIRLPAPDSGERAEHVSEEEFKTVVNGDVDEAVMTALFGLERPHSDQAEKLRSDVAKLEVRAIRGLLTPEEKAELDRLSAQLPKTGSALVDQALRKLKERP